MNSKRFFAVALVCLSNFGGASAVAQDLVITNARILAVAGGDTEVIEGTILVRNGRIASVTEGPAAVSDALEIDARGMTAMPGFIDTHRHVMDNVEDVAGRLAWLDNQAPERMRDFLLGGFTTVMSAGDDTKGIVELRRRLEQGELAGPRLVVAGERIRTPGPGEFESCQANAFCRGNNSLVRTPEEARAKVRELASAGVDMVKIRLDRITEPQNVDMELLSAIADEARKQGIPSVVHATNVEDMIASVQVGATRLVHTPHTGVVSESEGARIVRETGVPMSTTLGVYVPVFGGDDNVPRFRNGGRYPAEAPARAGQAPVNARHLWDQGVVLAYGTDTGFLPADSLEHELRPLQLLFSHRDIVRMLTRNAAVFLDLEDQIGTIEAGKIADLVLLDGDPLSDIDDLLNVEVVIKGGRVVVDAR